jgi:hypothetical protein
LSSIKKTVTNEAGFPDETTVVTQRQIHAGVGAAMSVAPQNG